MRQTLLVAGISALAGSLAGVGATAWLLRDAIETRPPSGASSDSAQVAAHAALDDALLRRIESVEQALRSLQAQGTSPEGQSGIARPQPRVTPAPSPAAPPVGDPVFEAAVLDVLERAEEDRDSERNVRRSERAQEQAEHWTQELTRHLTLSPHQAAQVLELRTRLTADLRERRRTLSSGSFVPREQRRAAIEALRERAEGALRELLDPRQAALYDQLENELKIVRPPDAD